MKDDSAALVQRLISILDAVAAAPEDAGITEVARAVALPPSTVHRLLGAMMKAGWIEQNRQRRYGIGRGLYRIGSIVVGRYPLDRMARPFIDRVVTEIGVSCMFGVYQSHNHTIFYAAKADSSNPLQYRTLLNKTIDIVWGASGRTVLAFLAPEEVEAALQRAGTSPSGLHRVNRREVLRELERIRDRGYAVTDSQVIDGAIGVATPVRGVDGKIVGTLSVSIPKFQYERRREGAIAASLMANARSLSELLGWRDPAKPAEMRAAPGGPGTSRPAARRIAGKSAAS